MESTRNQLEVSQVLGNVGVGQCLEGEQNLLGVGMGSPVSGINITNMILEQP